ncbi:glutaminase [Granulosicoccus sp.]|nr:glutaminase [Granulosicoccus sp.]
MKTSTLQELIDDIDDSVAPMLDQGRVADYILTLACINPRQFGMAVHTVDGQTFGTGDSAIY